MLNNGTPLDKKIKLGKGLTSTFSKGKKSQSPQPNLLDRDENLKIKLGQIDKQLDLNKLLAEVQLQSNDSYTLRRLLAKLKEFTSELLKAEGVLHIKAMALVQASVQARCVQCRQLVQGGDYD